MLIHLFKQIHKTLMDMRAEVDVIAAHERHQTPQLLTDQLNELYTTCVALESKVMLNIFFIQFLIGFIGGFFNCCNIAHS